MNHEEICDLAFFCLFLSKRSFHVEQCFVYKEIINLMCVPQKFGACLVIQEMFWRQKDIRSINFLSFRVSCHWLCINVITDFCRAICFRDFGKRNLVEH